MSLHPLFTEIFDQHFGLNDLNARIDNALELMHRRISAVDSADSWQAWLIISHARTHLADGVMTTGDVDAWQHMGWIQDRLLDPQVTGVCGIPVDCGQDFYRCGQEAVTFCADCATELCAGCLTRCCMETYCSACKILHDVRMHR